MSDLAALTAKYKRSRVALEKAVAAALPVGQWCLYDAARIREKNADLASCSEEFRRTSGIAPEEIRRVRVVGYCTDPDEVQIDPPLSTFLDGRPLCVAAAVGKLEPIPGEGLAPGDMVRVRHDDGGYKLHAVTRAPWRLGHGKYVVGLSDVVGGYDLSRVVYLEKRP